MNGMYLVIEPCFLAFLLLASGAALYMGVFRACGPAVSWPRKWISGLLSGLIAGVAWFLMYSWSYLSW